MGMKKWLTAELDKSLAKELAEECGLVVMRSSLRAYEACGLLYTAGLGNNGGDAHV